MAHSVQINSASPQWQRNFVTSFLGNPAGWLAGDQLPYCRVKEQELLGTRATKPCSWGDDSRCRNSAFPVIFAITFKSLLPFQRSKLHRARVNLIWFSVLWCATTSLPQGDPSGQRLYFVDLDFSSSTMLPTWHTNFCQICSCPSRMRQTVWDVGTAKSKSTKCSRRPDGSPCTVSANCSFRESAVNRDRLIRWPRRWQILLLY